MIRLYHLPILIAREAEDVLRAFGRIQ